MNNLARAQRSYDNVLPFPYGDDDDQADRQARVSAATTYLAALQAGNPAARLPLHGVTRSAPLDTMLTWLSTDSATRLLAACSAALTGRDAECAGLLKSFSVQAAAEYADDNVEAWL
ncbi:MAG: hypothetical protein Q7T97_02340 [Burkholderiaceae bacterium]|nr:hypothetical protein [Burkholderiaceae bacterium]